MIPTSKTLVFPGGSTEALAYRREASARGAALIGVSSLENDLAQREYDHWIRLSTVCDHDFADRLREIIERHHINAVFCAHSVIHDRVRAILRTYGLLCRMANVHPAEARQRSIEFRLDQPKSLIPYTSAVADLMPNSRELEIAGLLQASSFVPGQSDDARIATLLALFPSLPKGNVVEVGVYWGPSAFALTWLAGRYETGSVLAVDPWAADLAVQKEAPDQ